MNTAKIKADRDQKLIDRAVTITTEQKEVPVRESLHGRNTQTAIRNLMQSRYLDPETREEIDFIATSLEELEDLYDRTEAMIEATQLKIDVVAEHRGNITQINKALFHLLKLRRKIRRELSSYVNSSVDVESKDIVSQAKKEENRLTAEVSRLLKVVEGAEKRQEAAVAHKQLRIAALEKQLEKQKEHNKNQELDIYGRGSKIRLLRKSIKEHVPPSLFDSIIEFYLEMLEEEHPSSKPTKGDSNAA